MNFLRQFKNDIFTPVKISFIIAVILHLFILAAFSEEILLAVPEEREEKITFIMVNRKETNVNKNTPEKKNIMEEIGVEKEAIKKEKDVEKEKILINEDEIKPDNKNLEKENKNKEKPAEQKVEIVDRGNPEKKDIKEEIAITEKQRDERTKVEVEQDKKEQTEEMKEEIFAEKNEFENEKKAKNEIKTEEEIPLIAKNNKKDQIKESNKDKEKQKINTEFNPLLRQIQARHKYYQSTEVIQDSPAKNGIGDINDKEKDEGITGKSSASDNTANDEKKDNREVGIIDFARNELPVGASPPGVSKLEQPVYPPDLRKRRIEGKVVLKLLLSTEGKAEEILIYQSSGFEQFDNNAKKTAARWEFTPAEKENEKIKAWILVPIKFALN